MKKEYIEFTIAGILFNDYVVNRVESNEIADLQFPCYTYGFKFFTKHLSTNGKTKIINQQEYYIGKALTLDDVKIIYGENSIAVRNVEHNMQKNETPFLGAAGNVILIKKSAVIIDPHTLPNYKKEYLGCYNEKLKKLEDVKNEQTENQLAQ